MSLYPHQLRARYRSGHVVGARASGQSAGEDRAYQPRLEHEANDLAHRSARPGIEVELWQKFVFIVGVSGATAYFRSSIGAVRSDPDTGEFLARLVEEAAAVGRAEGIPLPPDQTERTMAVIAGLPEGTHGSMRDANAVCGWSCRGYAAA